MRPINKKEGGGSAMPAARLISAVSASRPRGRPRRPVPNPNRAHQPTIPSSPRGWFLGPATFPHPINFIAHRSLTVAARFGDREPLGDSRGLRYGKPSLARWVAGTQPQDVVRREMEDYPRNLTEFEARFASEEDLPGDGRAVPLSGLRLWKVVAFAKGAAAVR